MNVDYYNTKGSNPSERSQENSVCNIFYLRKEGHRIFLLRSTRTEDLVLVCRRSPE